MQASKIIYVLTGPTAVGKTELALLWAEAHGAEIVSADSLLFYQGMDIGTAKPTREERQRVPHHLIDILLASQPMNVARYVELAREAVHDIEKRGKKVLVVGGSGFYLKAFFDPVADDELLDPNVRDKVLALEADKGLAGLLTRLRELNPAGLGNLDIRNPRRVSRALERCLISGKTLVELQLEFESAVCPFASWGKRSVLLERSKESLWERIQVRTKAMLQAGLVNEVKSLLAENFEKNPSASGAIGYRETIQWIEKGGTQDELAEAINISTRQLVAKQMKWFRHQLEPDKIIDLDESTPEPAQLFS